MELTVAKIAQLLKGVIVGKGDTKINQLSKIQEGEPGSVTFLANPKYENYIYTTKASAVIVKKGFTPLKPVEATLIFVEDPYTSFSLLLEEYYKIISSRKKGVEEPAYLGKNTITGQNIYRGAFSYVGDNVKIGNDVKIFPHVYIGDNVYIGDQTIIYSGVKIYKDCVIGNHCVIHAGTVIGSEGFGFAPQADKGYRKVPQLGNVILEDRVEIGANTAIDCATLGSTIIRAGVKIDNLVQVAHNVEIGKNTAIAAQSGISGSSKIGPSCILAGQTGVVGHVEIGEATTIAAQSGITKSFKKGGEVLLGSPGFEKKKYLTCYALFKKLPELAEKIKNLEKITKFVT